MTHIEREVVINRPVEEVFGFLADGRNEPQYTAHMLRAQQVAEGPIGRGTQFRTEVTTNGRSMEMDLRDHLLRTPLAACTAHDQGPRRCREYHDLCSRSRRH